MAILAGGCRRLSEGRSRGGVVGEGITVWDENASWKMLGKWCDQFSSQCEYSKRTSRR